MSVAEMKKALIEEVESLNEEQLIHLTQFVDAIKNMPPKEYNLLPHVETIVKEREEVLKKLAQ